MDSETASTYLVLSLATERQAPCNQSVTVNANIGPDTSHDKAGYLPLTVGRAVGRALAPSLAVRSLKHTPRALPHSGRQRSFDLRPLNLVDVRLYSSDRAVGTCGRQAGTCSAPGCPSPPDVAIDFLGAASILCRALWMLLSSGCCCCCCYRRWNTRLPFTS